MLFFHTNKVNRDQELSSYKKKNNIKDFIYKNYYCDYNDFQLIDQGTLHCRAHLDEVHLPFVI